MITELGGDISVESQLNVGTKFIIILPLLKN
jgi:chemotaxis protein histidine kinase CheA